jgi:hypothetical protein
MLDLAGPISGSVADDESVASTEFRRITQIGALFRYSPRGFMENSRA